MTGLIREVADSDLAGVQVVCRRTAAAGGDATELVSEPDLPGDVYVMPYVEFEPATSLVLVDERRVLGYAVAAVDTAAFERRCAAEWWPRLRKRYPDRSGPRPLDGFFLSQVHDPPSTDPTLLGRYPSHLHINLLAETRGSGWGRTLISSILDLLVAHGSVGVHLGVDPANEPAQRFYERTGFQRLDTDGAAVLFARSLVRQS